MNTRNDSIILKPFYIKAEPCENSPAPAADLFTGDPEAGQFRLYDGKTLPQVTNATRRRYTVRTRFYLNPALQGRELFSLYVGLFSYPRNIYLNGTQIFTAGNHINGYNPGPYSVHNIYLSEDLLHFGEQGNELAIQIFPLYEYTAFSPVTLATYHANAERTFWHSLLAIHMIQAASVTSFIICLYLLFLFFTHKKKNLTFLYFALVCLGYIICYSNMSLHHEGTNFHIMEKISRCVFPWTVLFLTFFIMQYTEILHKRKLLKIILGLPALFLTILTAIQPDEQSVGSVFSMTMLYYLLPLLLFSFILLCISVFRKGNRRSIIILISFSVIFATAGLDMYHVIQAVIPYLYALVYGFILMVIAVFFVLAYDQAMIFRDSQAKRKELDAKNQTLNHLIANIRIVVDNLIRSGTRLEEIAAASHTFMDQYENNSRQIIDQVLQRFNEIENMIGQVSLRMDVAATTMPQALSNQTAFVEEVSSTINNMNEQMKTTLDTITKVNAFTTDLYHLAADSSTGIGDSKETINRMRGYSQFLTDVLVIIEDITEKTSILAINAAIESARRGKEGKGFAVISNEIRSLSSQSKQSLEKSFSQLGEMHKVIEKGITLSDEVNEQLLKIIDRIKQVAGKIENFTQVISEQKEQSSHIDSAVKELLKDTLTIKELSEGEQQENGKIKQNLTSLQETFTVINTLLKNQIEQGENLKKRMDDLRNVTKENLDNITLLNSSLDTVAIQPESI